MKHAHYLALLTQARRRSRSAADAEDLLQNALLAAIKAGRADMTLSQNRRWMAGTLRNRAAFEARSAARRQRREIQVDLSDHDPPQSPVPQAFLDTLPTSLRSLALLALTGHTRTEISYLLRITDMALRQRILQLRRRWAGTNGGSLMPLPHLRGTLPFGTIRSALHHPVQTKNTVLGSHDPDGHLFTLSAAHKTAHGGNKTV